MLSRNSAILGLVIISGSATTYGLYNIYKKKKMADLDRYLEESAELFDQQREAVVSLRSKSCSDVFEGLALTNLNNTESDGGSSLSLASTAESWLSASYLIGELGAVSTAISGRSSLASSFAESMPCSDNISTGYQSVVYDVTARSSFSDVVERSLIDLDKTPCINGYCSEEDDPYKFINMRRRRVFDRKTAGVIPFEMTDSLSDLLEEENNQLETSTKNIRRFAGSDALVSNDFVTPVKPRNRNSSISKYVDTPSKVYNYPVPAPVYKPFDRLHPAPQPFEYPLENRASRLRRLELQRKKELAEASTAGRPFTSSRR